jgi:hypothetical protein
MFGKKGGMGMGMGSLRKPIAIIGVLLGAAGGIMVGPELGIAIPDFLGLGVMITGFILIGAGLILNLIMPSY